jgi:ABC-type cobalamin/Fe3+-siderophores transport system ATPase subunit
VALDVDLSLWNYRRFDDSRPAHVRITDGFTALLGVNNAGKSSLLRFFYEFRNLFDALQDPSQIGTFANALTGARVLNATPTVLPGERPWHTENDRPIRIDLTVRDSDEGALGPQEAPYTVRFEIDQNNSYASAQLLDHTGQVVEPNSSWSTFTDPSSPHGVLGAGASKFRFEPLAAASRAFTKTLYAGSFRNVVTTGSGTYYDLTIGDAFISQFAHLRSGTDPIANEAVDTAVQELARIFDYGRLEVNAAPDGASLQVMTDGRSRRTSELGAGFTQFLMLIVNVLVRKPTFLLIDEPETALHASLQLDFLTTLGRGCSHGVLYSTHSAGLAHAAADRIYSVQRSGASSRVDEYEATPALPQFLGQLGFEGSAALGFRAVLLVEGVTEVRTIQQWLRLYGKEHEVVLIPLGGGNLIKAGAAHELAQLTRLGVPVAALIDSEKRASDEALAGGRQAFVDDAIQLGIDVHILHRRATENYLTAAAVKAELGPDAAALSEFQALKDAGKPWGKRSNWRIAARMTSADLAETDLGAFLQGL